MQNKLFPQKNNGQVLVIFAVSLLVLLIFIGLAVDGSQLFLNYTRLKRAVDAAAVAAANDFRRSSTLDQMDKAALEILAMHQVDGAVNIKVYMCDAVNNTTGLPPADGLRDPALATEVPEFYKLCPASGLQKKLIYVRAFENSPTYFVSLIGIHTIPISTTAVAEAAPVDLVIVLDTSGSMGRDTLSGYNTGDFNPAACNAANNCEPLKSAKEAAKYLINSLYKGYDRAAVVTFDTQAYTRFSLTDSNGDLDAASAAVDSQVKLHYDAPVNKLYASWYNAGTNGRFNPVNPEDRDNDGDDADSAASTSCIADGSGWIGGDPNATPPTGKPCDYNGPNQLDAFDWDQNSIYSGQDCPANSDYCKTKQWIAANGPMSLVSTCSGCGIREATANLVQNGRSNAVWVVVFLSDGLANMSDTPTTYPYNAGTGQGIPTNYPNGFCGGKIDVSGTGGGVNGTSINFWKTNCVDSDVSTRYCINKKDAAGNDTCPPGSTSLDGNPAYTNPISRYSPPYSVEDYARDMTDRAALTVVRSVPPDPSRYNPYEPVGNDIAIYSVGFGDIAALGEPLLRYMAAVGDDGDRNTDPCVGVPAKHSCGQYYFAQNSSDLLPVFQDIASRIYTKISE